MHPDGAGLAVYRHAAGVGTAAAPRDATVGDAAGVGLGDASLMDVAGLGTAAAPGDAPPGDASPGDAAMLGSAAEPWLVSICGKALVQELSLLPVLPLLIRFGRGGSPKRLPVEAMLDVACKAA